VFLFSLTPAIKNLIIIFIGVVVAIFVVYYLFFAPRNKTRQKDILKKKPDDEIPSVNNKPFSTDSSPSDKTAIPIDTQANPLPVTNDFATVDKVIEDNIKETKIFEENVNKEVVEADLPNENITNSDSKVNEEQKDLEDGKEEKSKHPQKDELGRYHVLYRREDNKWYIKREGSDKVIRVLETQKEAIAYATIKSINQDTTMVIHKKDGKIRKQNY
jgi:hypothetical protein